MQYPPSYPSKIEYRPGRIQTLSPEQEVILKQCWATFFKYSGYPLSLSVEDIKSKDAFVVSSIVEASGNVNEIPGSGRHKHHTHHKASPERLAAIKENLEREYVIIDDASTETKYMFFDVYKEGSREVDCEQSRTQKVKPKERPETNIFPFFKHLDRFAMHHAVLSSPRNDLIDNLFLRFIRARKNHYENAMRMLVHSLNWRANEFNVDVIFHEGDAPSVIEKKNQGLVKNLQVGKFFLCGEDKDRNPLLVFQAKKHFRSDSDLDGTKLYAVLLIEWTRLFLREVNESVDTCSVLFDLSGFSLKNADYPAIKFLASLFEAHYPESLGVIIVHNAPWVFSTVWSMIKPWLDPVVSSKIHFTKNVSDLKTFVDIKYIPKYLGGENATDVAYDVPRKVHAQPMKNKDEIYYELIKQRTRLHLRIIETTLSWISTTDPEVSSKYLRDKIQLSYELSDNFIALDPYQRNPGMYDRSGVLKLKN